jgi:hypothetical protein
MAIIISRSRAYRAKPSKSFYFIPEASAPFGDDPVQNRACVTTCRASTEAVDNLGRDVGRVIIDAPHRSPALPLLGADSLAAVGIPFGRGPVRSPPGLPAAMGSDRYRSSAHKLPSQRAAWFAWRPAPSLPHPAAFDHGGTLAERDDAVVSRVSSAPDNAAKASAHRLIAPPAAAAD